MRRSAVLCVVTSAIVALLLLVAPQADAATTKSLTMNSSVEHLTSSSGKSLSMSLMASKDTTSGSTTKATMTLTLSNASTPFGMGETHSWNFMLTRSSFGYTAPTGKLSSASSAGSQIAPFGSIALKFTKTSQSTRQCKVAGSETTVKGTLKGSLHFTTNTSAWGKVGSSVFTFSTPNFVRINNGCNDGATSVTTCYSGIQWYAPNPGWEGISGSALTYSGGSQSTIIGGGRFVNLSKPTGASRSDAMTQPGQPLTVDSNGNLVIKSKSGTSVSGSAVIPNGTTSSSSQPCKTSAGATQTLSTTNHVGTWSSPPSSPLTLHFAIEGNIVAPTTGTGQWLNNTYA